MSGLLLRFGTLFLLGILLAARPAAATHLVGGELTYRYLDSNGPTATPVRYELTARVYFNKEAGSSAPNGTATIPLTFYSKAPTGSVLRQVTVTQQSFAEITPPVQPNCSIATPRVTLGLYVTTVALPLVPEGYRASFTASARNTGIVNLFNSVNESMTITVDLAPPTLPNTSPEFSSDALTAVCLNDTSFVLNNAYDAEGDRLSYSLATPSSTSAAQPVSYATGYDGAHPFGAAGYATVDARTGLARYFSRTQGVFLVAIDVREYRTVNGQEVLLGTLRRDIQLVVRSCGAVNQPPFFTAATTPQRDFQLGEGQALSFDVATADPEGLALNMSVSSVLLDGPGGIDASFNGQAGTRISSNASAVGNVSISRLGSIAGVFRLVAGCGMARPAPYDVLVTATDAGCGSKAVAAVFRITITRPAPPARIRGDSVLCAQRVATYTVSGGPAYSRYRWSVRGGRVLTPALGSTVQVEWLTAGANYVAVRGITAAGCPTDSVGHAVTVLAGPAVTGPATYCRTANTGLRFAVAGPPAAYQWHIADGTLVSGQGTNEVVVDVAPGATATLQVSRPETGACTTTLRISQDNTCLYFYNVITPNGDGQNDRFIIENIEQYPHTALTIYNRWGRRVYHTADYHNAFGSEADVAPGVYYYLCRLADGTLYKGWFEVIK